MQRLVLRVGLLVAAVAVAALAAGAAVAADAPDGQAIFLAQKCNMCHAVPAASIAATTKSEKMKGPDLPGAEPRSAEWLTKYLQKQEKIGDKAHAKEVKLGPEELAALVKFVQKQK